MRSDVFGCNRMHFGALGSVPTLVEFFGCFRFVWTTSVVFGRSGGLGAYFYGPFTFRGLTFIGANYYYCEVALT